MHPLSFGGKFLLHILIDLRIALRAAMTRVLLGLGVICVATAVVLASFSARQPTTFALDIGFSLLRVLLCLMSLVWLQELLGQAIEKRFIHQLLVFPEPRYRILVRVFISVAGLLLAAILLYAVLLFVAVSSSSSYIQATPPSFGMAYIATWALVYLDILVVSAFAMLMLMVSTTPYFSLLLGICFYVIAHSLVDIIHVLQLSPYAEAAHQGFILPLLNVLRYLVPDLSAFDVRDWSLYDETLDVAFVVSQIGIAGLYLGILLTLSAIILRRREFT